MEKLEKERALVHELTLAKSSEESQIAVLNQQLGDKDGTINALQGETRSLKEEVVSLNIDKEAREVRMEEMTAKIDTQARELDELREVQLELMTQIGEKNAEIEQNELRANQMREEFAEESAKLSAEKEMLAQEVSIAQQNIAELLGAKKEGVVVDNLTNQEPPTLSVMQVNMVDKSAYEALQQAYEDIEERYHESNEGSVELRRRLHDMKTRLDTANAKNAEFAYRIEKCREEYEAKAREVIQLQKEGAGTGDAGEVGALQMKLQEMEDNQEQITKSWEAAIQELSARKEEIKAKNMKVAELDGRIADLEETLQVVQTEFTNFQDKHDHVVNEKAARIDEKDASIDAKCAEIADLRTTVSSLSKDKGKLETTVQQLREQLDMLKRQAKSTERSCPVCNTKFPGRVSQQDFERHVQGHFNR